MDDQMKARLRMYAAEDKPAKPRNIPVNLLEGYTVDFASKATKAKADQNDKS